MKTKEQHEDEIVEAIIKHKIRIIQHIFGYYTDIKSSQFYNLELEKSERIKGAISRNKAKDTGVLLDKWLKSENATLQIAAYRLICTNEERQMLNQQYIDHTSKGESIKMTAEEREAEILRLKNKLLNAD